MNFDPELTPRKQIRNLLSLLLAAIIAALLLALLMLYNYNSEGRYSIKNALLSPQVISQISQKSPINKIEFSAQDPGKKRTSLVIDPKEYEKFYQEISSDESLTAIPDDLQASFSQMPSSSLILLSKNDSDHSSFQEIQFLYKGDYYRLRLREANATQWIYFYHPGIYDKSYQLLTGTP